MIAGKDVANKYKKPSRNAWLFYIAFGVVSLLFAFLIKTL
jgi:hypothetical protein